MSSDFFAEDLLCATAGLRAIGQPQARSEGPGCDAALAGGAGRVRPYRLRRVPRLVEGRPSTGGLRLADKPRVRVALIGIRGLPAQYGGSETAAQEIYPRLAARGHAAVVYCRRHSVDPAQRWYEGVRTVVLPSVNTKALDTITATFLALFDVVVMTVPISFISTASATPSSSRCSVCAASGSSPRWTAWTGLAPNGTGPSARTCAWPCTWP